MRYSYTVVKEISKSQYICWSGFLLFNRVATPLIWLISNFSNIKPNQILVEFDELQKYNFVTYYKAIILILLMLNNGYQLIKTNNFPNFLFVNKLHVNN